MLHLKPLNVFGISKPDWPKHQTKIYTSSSELLHLHGEYRIRKPVEASSYLLINIRIKDVFTSVLRLDVDLGQQFANFGIS
jgi:hypothetical protein